MRSTRFPWPFTILLITLGCLVGSYVPLVQLGSIAGVHIDLSLLYIAVMIVVVASVKQLWKNRNALISSWPWRLVVLFAIYTTAATLWSPNPTRAYFTAGFLWLLIALASSVIVWWPNLKKESRVVKRIMATGFIVAGLIALWQIFGEALGVSNAFTLLPPMYQSGHFGVARPLALALEPQFFASLLLVPFAWGSYNFLKGDRRWMLIICLVATCTLLLLTLSRGGLIAATIIAIALIVSLKKWRSGILLVGLGCISLIASGLIIAAAATLNSRDTISGYTADQRTISQITLGIVQLPQQQQTTPPPSPSPHSQPRANGYVKSSTASRLSMSEKSIELWRSSPATMLFGVGTGGFGARLHQQNSHFPTSTIVNNYYLEMLAELGVVGIALFSAFIISLCILLVRARQWLAISLLLGFLVQWYFFSGNANVIHVWVVIGLSIIISSPKLQRCLIQ